MSAIFRSWYFKGVAMGLCGMLLLQLAACGTLIYPERRGQSKGELDPVIVVLDAVGILFFVIPGVAAFIIDFNTGAIYLPPGKGSQERLNKIREGFKGAQVEAGSDGSLLVRFAPGQLTPDMIDSFGQTVGDQTFSLSHPELSVERLDDRMTTTRSMTSSWVVPALQIQGVPL